MPPRSLRMARSQTRILFRMRKIDGVEGQIRGLEPGLWQVTQ